MLVKEILAGKHRSGQPLGVGPDSPVSEAVGVMVEHDTGSCVVTDPAGKLLGMVTFREILRGLDANSGAALQTPVREVMDKDPIVATPEDTVDQIRQVMTKNHIRYLPVMTAGRLSDVISFYDVARAVAKNTDFENRMLKNYINDWPESG